MERRTETGTRARTGLALWRSVLRWAAPIASLGAFIIAGIILHHILTQTSYRELRQAFLEISHVDILLAVLLTAASFFILTLYDVLAFRYVGISMPYHRKAFTSFIAYSLSNIVGHSYLSGGSIRFRIYSAWGLSGEEIGKVIFFCLMTGWLGFASTGAVALLLLPASDLPAAFPSSLRLLLGLLLTGFVAAYVILCFTVKDGICVRSRRFQLPRGTLALAQVVLGVVDLTVAATIPYSLMVFSNPIGFPTFLGLFIISLLTGLVSMVPGGLGVFDTLMAVMLQPFAAVPHILSTILIFRIVYYLFPLVISALMLSGFEAVQRRRQLARLSAALQALSPVVPDVLAILMVVGGVVLLVSGATPPVHGRIASLRHVVPLPMLEASHFLGSVVGIALVLVGRAVQRRVDAAYWVALALLGAGIIFSLLKGLDYEEAIVLAALIAALAPWRAQFYRRGSLFAPRLGITWVAAITAILLSVAWLAYFAHKHVEYSSQLWWQFTSDVSAPGVLRASVGVGIAVIVFSLAHLLRPAPARLVAPTQGVTPEVEKSAAESDRTYAFLAFLGDKRFMLNRRSTGFVMYNVSGPCAVAMGDPVGNARAAPELAWDFVELSDRLGVMPVFYEVTPEHLHVYADLGLMPFKFGEEALVRLDCFSMDGASFKSARHGLNKLEREGVEFTIEPQERIPALLPELKYVSDDWLRHKHTREKGFSLGFFNETYLTRFRHVILRQGDRILAFANLLETAGRQELSVDLMRHLEDAPHGIMDFMFFRLMIWGKEEGYGQFNLGLAPLSGIESGRALPLWNRLATLAFYHSEWFYNLQGLRQYKEKFDPEWRPSYITAPGHVAALPRALGSIASLVNRGMTGIITR